MQFEEDYETLIEYGNMQEHFEMSESLWAYEKAESLMRQKGIPISPELPNNIGVLKTKSGKCIVFNYY